MKFFKSSAAIFFCLFVIILIIVGVLISKRMAHVFSEARLKSFYNLTREDPLFYSSFFDEKGFEKAIGRLKTTEDQLKAVLIKNSEQRLSTQGNSELIKESDINILRNNNLFSYQFLENLILINKKTNEFFKNPSDKLAQEILDIYDDTADFYIKEALAKIKILQSDELNKMNIPYYLIFIGSVSSNKVAEGDFQIIKENGHKLKEEIAKRRDCFLGKNNCKMLQETEGNDSSLALMKSLEGEEFNLSGENIDFIRRSISSFSEYPGNVRGPYKIESSCWGNTNSQQWMYLNYSKVNNDISVTPKLASQNYYSKVNATLPLGKVYLKNDLEYTEQAEATTYECMDLNFYPQLLTLDFLKKQIESGLITKNDLKTNQDYRLLMENQFGLITPFINQISNQLEILSLHQTINKTTISPIMLFSVRSAYSIFAFPFAKSIWRIDKRLQYFVPKEEGTIKTPIIYFTLDELKNMGYTEEEIKKFHLNKKKFIGGLLEN